MTWQLTELPCWLWITCHSSASSIVQTDENHWVPDQGCREKSLVLPTSSAIISHACCWLNVIWHCHVVYISTRWWISAGDVPFRCRNLITLCTSTFNHVSINAAILQLMLGDYDQRDLEWLLNVRKPRSIVRRLAILLVGYFYNVQSVP